jgi:hypothetical protein
LGQSCISGKVHIREIFKRAPRGPLIARGISSPYPICGEDG